MKKLSVDGVATLLDLANASDAASNEMSLQQEFGLTALVPYYIKAFYKIKNWPGRMNISFWLVRYAKTNPAIVEMAIFGTNDRSYIVRNYCFSILAYAGNKTHLNHLKTFANHKDEKTRSDAAAARDAIVNENHHYWIDREHEGNAFWEPGEVKNDINA